MASVKQLNSKAEVMGKSAALFMNINASKGLHEVMKTNLGPKGTIKMLVGGSGGTALECLLCHTHVCPCNSNQYWTAYNPPLLPQQIGSTPGLHWKLQFIFERLHFAM